MSLSSAHQTVRFEQHGCVATVTLHRPDRRNALDTALIHDLDATMSRAAEDPSVRAIVLTGAGAAFCAGLDLHELGTSGANLRLVGPAAGQPRPWHTTTKPVIGAVNGPAVTAGLEIALTCDFLIASEQASFGDTHARVGVLPGWGLSYLLPQAVGVRRAREMSLTGRLVGAREALEWGLVNRIVPAAELLFTAQTLAAQMAELDPAITAEFLTLYRDNAASTVAEAVEREQTRSLAWADHAFAPDNIGAVADAVIERGRLQG